jgi:hypothetical protein
MGVEALGAAGILDPDAPISRYLPGLSPTLGRATLHQLISHTGGLDDARARPGQTSEEALDDLNDRALVTEPGFVVSRSRYSFPLAVRVIEKTLGRTFEEFVTAAILDPLGMESTTLDLDEARSWGLIDGVGISTQPDAPFSVIPAEPEVRGLPVTFSNTRDVVALLHSWMTGGLSGGLPWEMPMKGSAPNDAGFRNGVLVDQFQGRLRVSRSTSDLGFGAGIYFFPDMGRGVVGWSPAGAPRRTLRATQELLFEDFPPPPSDTVAGTESPSETAGIPFHESGWAGDYRNGDEKLELRQTGERLTFFSGTGELGIRPGPDGRMTVVLDDGRATDITFRLVHDEKGRRYLVRGSDTDPKAFLNERDRNW